MIPALLRSTFFSTALSMTPAAAQTPEQEAIFMQCAFNAFQHVSGQEMFDMALENRNYDFLVHGKINGERMLTAFAEFSTGAPANISADVGRPGGSANFVYGSQRLVTVGPNGSRRNGGATDQDVKTAESLSEALKHCYPLAIS